MAKLPRSPIAAEVRNNYTPVREARASGADPVGGALERAGGAAFELGNRMAEAKINADMTKASIRLRSKLDAARREIETDMEADPATFEARFRERASQIANEEAGALSSPAGRKAFGLKAQEDVEDYSIRMRDVTRRRQIENVKAETLQAGAEYELLAKDPSKPRELLDASKADYDALIDRQLKAGIYTPDEVAAAKIAAEEVYRTGVSTRHLTNVDAMLDAGRYGEAEEYFKVNYGEVDPAVREKAEDVLQAKKREGVAIQTADRFWADADGDYGKAIAEAYKITNPDERLAVESRLAQLKAQGDAAREATDRALLEEGMGFITKGQSLPADLLRRASPLVVDRLQTEQRTRRLWEQQMATLSAEERRALKEASAVTKDYIRSIGSLDPEAYLAGPDAWPADVQAEWDRMAPTDKSDIIADIAARTARGGTFDAVDKVLADLVKQVPMLGPEKMKGKDFGASTKSKGGALREEREVRASLYRQAQEHARRTGGAPITPQDSKVMIARAFREANAKRYPYPEPGVFLRQIDAGIRSNPVWGETQAYLTEKLGRAPTDDETMTMLRAMGEAE
jgi:hypothetical protein